MRRWAWCIGRWHWIRSSWGVYYTREKNRRQLFCHSEFNVINANSGTMETIKGTKSADLISLPGKKAFKSHVRHSAWFHFSLSPFIVMPSTFFMSMAVNKVKFRATAEKKTFQGWKANSKRRVRADEAREGESGSEKIFVIRKYHKKLLKFLHIVKVYAMTGWGGLHGSFFALFFVNINEHLWNIIPVSKDSRVVVALMPNLVVLMFMWGTMLKGMRGGCELVRSFWDELSLT